MTPWHPLATAPETGERILIERRDWSSSSMAIAFWHDGQNTPGWVYAILGDPVDMRHEWLWHPLPERSWTFTVEYDDSYPPPCTSPDGKHDWPRDIEEHERCLCTWCGADGDA